MKNLKRNTKKMMVYSICLLFILIGLSQSANAVAFKLDNSTQYTIRAKVFDRGAWRNYTVIQPGECKVFGPKVTRSEHSVVIQMSTNNGWKTIYSNNHGSRAFTRIVHVTEQSGDFFFSWWDEPPGCRDCPSYNRCLIKSGWYSKENAIKIGVFLGRKLFSLGG